jgi:hypothetical protein
MHHIKSEVPDVPVGFRFRVRDFVSTVEVFGFDQATRNKKGQSFITCS